VQFAQFLRGGVRVVGIGGLDDGDLVARGGWEHWRWGRGGVQHARHRLWRHHRGSLGRGSGGVWGLREWRAGLHDG